MLTEIFSYDFMQRAVLAVIAISVFAPILGIFLILRHQSLMSDTLSHVSLAGVALGILLGTSITWSTVCVVVIAAIVLEYLQTIYKHYIEISTAILMSLGLAVALIVTSKSENASSINLEQYLFGSIITINRGQIIALFAIAIIVLMLTCLFIRPMYVLTFDEETAFVDGLPVRVMSTLFNIVTGIAIALTIPAAGALLVSTIMVLPASIAMRLGKNFKSVMVIGIIVGFIGMLSGIVVSYYVGTPASATITVIFVGIFILVNLLMMFWKRR